jgi:prepilin-type N-terminal cleavage/methylation domain-containing protein
MLNSPFRARSSRASQAAGFTLVELLVVIGIIAILAGVAFPAITKGLLKARESAAMQTASQIGLAEFQYANDNSTYPDGKDAQAIATSLLNGKYVSDPNTFYIASDNSAAKPTTLAAFNGGAGNVSYDFTGVNGTGTGAATFNGIGSSASDLLPVVWSEGDPGAVIPAAADTGSSFTPSTGIFGTDGIAVCYHGHNAAFITPNTKTNVTWPPQGQVPFVGQAFDPAGVTYVTRFGASGK